MQLFWVPHFDLKGKVCCVNAHFAAAQSRCGTPKHDAWIMNDLDVDPACAGMTANGADSNDANRSKPTAANDSLSRLGNRACLCVKCAIL